jgi:hypothetical protein
LGRAIGDSVHGGGPDILPTRHGPLETISASGVGHGGGVLEYVLPDLMDRVHFIVGYYASFEALAQLGHKSKPQGIESDMQ